MGSDDHPAIAQAEETVRAYRNYVKDVMLWQIREFWQEYKQAPDEDKPLAYGSVKSQLDLYRQTWGEEPDLSEL